MGHFLQLYDYIYFLIGILLPLPMFLDKNVFVMCPWHCVDALRKLLKQLISGVHLCFLPLSPVSRE